MASAIDLCKIDDVRAWLNISPVQDEAVSTTVTASITPGIDRIVTPVSMVGISTGTILQVGSGSTVEVIVVKIADLTSAIFTADFNLSHTGPVTVTDITNLMLGRIITAKSVAFMRKTGRIGIDGTIPVRSVYNEQVDFNDWYDGNGNVRLFVREWPIASVSALSINGAPVTASMDPKTPGYVIDSTRKSISLRGSCTYRSVMSRSYGAPGFPRGIQNVNVQYRAGWVSTPEDVQDACIEWVALDYRRRNWIDQAANAHSDTSGAVKYQTWEMPPKIASVIQDYKRVAA